ncbi:MAG TPA: enoyl-CoA hydratase-related protein [Acidimicrobiales bacterium]|nr:enoyl-CoA hydratase-related protein [Acidimicrobiales bacterium]
MNIPVIDGVEVTLDNHLLQIRIARPERLNAVTPDQMNYISQICAAAEHDDDVRVVVIAGSKGAFCSGADLTDTDLSADGGQIPPVSMGRNLFLPFLELSKPLVAAIEGVAAGGGLGLALCCDIRIASTQARFATSFTRIGITANDTVAWLLPRIVGTAKALELIYNARPIDATEAERIGLVSYVHPQAEFEERMSDFLQRLLEAPPVAIRFSKRLVMDGLNRSYRDHVLAQEYASLANRVLADEDISEGVNAFKEKRAPNFRGSQKKPRWQNY